MSGVFREVSVKGSGTDAHWEHFPRQGKEDSRYQGPARKKASVAGCDHSRDGGDAAGEVVECSRVRG